MTREHDSISPPNPDMAASEPLPRLGEIGLEGFAPYLMNRIMGRYNAAMRNELAQMGLSTPKARALSVLAVIEAPLIKELSVYAVTDQSTLSRVLNQLDTEGLIRRAPCPYDSRATHIHLTPAGRTMFEQLWPRMAEAQAGLFKDIPDAERLAFLATLQRMLRNIRKHKY